MSKVLIVYEYVMCDHVLHGIFSDIEEGERYIKEKNVSHNEEQKLLEECRKCYVKGYDGDKDAFNNKNTCVRACIEKDRHGEYCKNHVGEYDNYHAYYSGEEMTTMDGI